MVVKLKPGVRLDGINPVMCVALLVCKSVYRAQGETSMTITSVTDGRHSVGSYHHSGRAFDLRLPNVSQAWETKAMIESMLGAEFDVILEPTHIHVEYDPK